jgi:uncharacterized repeat protein (TIGR03803 family)
VTLVIVISRNSNINYIVARRFSSPDDVIASSVKTSSSIEVGPSRSSEVKSSREFTEKSENGTPVMKKLNCRYMTCLELLVSLLIASPVAAQTFKTLVKFSGTNGAFPESTLIQGSDGNLYGTTLIDGPYSHGTVFQITPAGVLTTLYNFCTFYACTDGGSPRALVQGADGNLYGTTNVGGTYYNGGTVYRLTPSGILTTLYNFCSLNNCTDGYTPTELLQGSDGNFYGTTLYGGLNNGSGNVICGFESTTGCGTIFKITPGGELTTIYNFCSLADCADGMLPGALIEGADGYLYGTTGAGGLGTACGGPAGCGTVFKLSITSDLTTLYAFCSIAKCADGDYPTALLQGSDGNFYGTTELQGPRGGGTAFGITPTGVLTTLYGFCIDCFEGYEPAGLVQGKDGNFYGTTSYGGQFNPYASVSCGYGCGTFFQLTPDGVLTTLYDFCSDKNCADGAQPRGLVMQSTSGTFFGTTPIGGVCAFRYARDGCGIVYSLSLDVVIAPHLPASLGFGSQAVNTRSTSKTLSIRNLNAGKATLDLNNFAVTPPFALSATTCGATLSAGKVCSVSIAFAPTGLGPATGTLSVMDNAPGNPQIVTLTGSGIVQTTLTPISTAFTRQAIGTTSLAKTFTLRNNLLTSLNGISYSTSGPFAVAATTCGTTLASKQTCTVSVTFSPTIIGVTKGTLRVSDSANNSPQIASLAGTGY